MILEQLYLGCLSQASYLVGDENAGVAAVVDPRRDIDEYLAMAERHGVRIEAIVLTHFHADFVSGHLELQRATNAPIYLGAAAQADYEFLAATEEMTLSLGDVRLRFLETPGHTPESICVLVMDGQRHAEEPHAVFTGDTLFIGDVGRPDLLVASGRTPQEMAAQLYDSLHDKLLKLPDATRVYPGHGAGSSCGKKLSIERSSTMGRQRQLNYALQPMLRADFVKMLTSELSEAPAYFVHNAKMNRQVHAMLDDVLQRSLRPLDVDELLDRKAAGAILLDVRSGKEYTAVHIIGSLHVGLDGNFASWCGSMLSADEDIVLIAEAGMEAEAAMRLGRIGFDQVVGYLDGGVEALESRADLLRHTPQITAQALIERLGGSEPPHVLDVRTVGEWDEEHIVGGVHIPLTELPDRLAEVPRNSNFVIVCEGGYRSLIAASILERNDFANFSDLAGGYLAWDLTRIEG